MKSNITKSAAAAMILIGAFIFLTQGNGTGLVLANVIEQFSRPYQCTQTVYYGDKEHQAITLYRLNPSQRREERPNNEVFVVDMRQTPVCTLYLYENDKFAKVTKDYGMGPRKDPDLLQMLSNMEAGTAEKLGVQTIDGIEAEGFRTVGKYNDITIWGDVETGLPIKVTIIHVQHDRKIVMDNFRFDVTFDPALFSTDPPDGYQVHEVSINQETSNAQAELTDESMQETVEGPEAFIPHSCTETVYRNGKEILSARKFYKTLSIRREEHSDDSSIHIVDITEKPAKVLRMEPDTKNATLQILYKKGGAKSPDMLAMLARMREGKSEKLGIQNIDGTEAEGLRTVSPYNDITIWASIQTGLPVKIEVVHVKANQKIVMSQFDFETELDDSLFLTTPPEGYELNEKHVGLDLKAEAVTKDQIQSPGYPVYVFKNKLSWTLEPTIVECNVADQKAHVIAAVSKDGRHVVLAQCSVYDILKEKISSGQGNKCLEANGFTVWNGGPEKWYSKIALESAQDEIPPGISEDRTGYAIETPQGSVIIVGVNGTLTDAELKELVENLELCTNTAPENQANTDSAAALLSSKAALEAKIKEAEQSEDKESALLNLALLLSGKKMTPEEKTVALRMLKLNEKDLISGLANYIKLSDGIFPDSLDTKELIRESGKLASAKNLAEEEMKLPAMEIVYAGAFYEKLLRDKKEPHYICGLKFADASQAAEMLRWKADKGGFQVVYTDLSIKTVTP